jgi:CHAT domain-containing protein
MDRVVSSYTPTIRALRDARVPRPPNGNEAGDPVVIITGPDIDGPAGLPRARREAEAIRGLIPGAVILNGPTRQVALNALRNSRVAHLACHAVADWDDPGASRLILDERSRPLTVADLTFADVGGELAYLSACETGVSSADLVDESVHLTGAFHLAGFRHVIGTLWPVNDAAAYSVAVDVYTRLTGGEGGALNFTDCARAIHDAIRHARSSRPDTPTAWAAFLHTGP